MGMFKKMLVLIFSGVVGWIVCGGIFYLSEILFKEYLAIIIHFILAPFVFVVIAKIFYTYFGFTRPIYTALILTTIVIALDFFIVALLIEKNLSMFKSLMGTWLPFLFIFLAIYLTGLHLTDKSIGK